MGKNNRITINWEEYILHKKIPSDLEDIHHIISRKLANVFNVQDSKNKVKIKRIRHVHLNWLFGDHQNPREQLKDMIDIRKTALSKEVNEALYNILQLEDERFYNDALIKHKKQRWKKKNITDYQKTQTNVDIDYTD